MFKILKKNIKNLKCRNGLVLHSSFLYFREEIKNKNILEKLKKETNCENIFLPTFSYNNYNTGLSSIFEKKQVPLKMGYLSRLAVEKKAGVRTKNPVHSYICIGKKKQNLNRIRNDISFGKESIFEYFCQNKFLWCSYAADINPSFTIFYHAEQLAGVPYRKWIKFRRKFRFGNKFKIINYKYYSRKNNEKIDLKKASNYLIKNGILKKFFFKEKVILLGRCDKITSSLVLKIKKEPRFLLSKS